MLSRMSVTFIRCVLSLVAFAFTGLTSSYSAASVNECSDLFLPYGEPIADRLSRVYHWRLEAQVMKELKLLREARADAERDFDAQISARQNLRTVDLESVIRTSPTLRERKLETISIDSLRPPGIEARTKAALHDSRLPAEDLRQILSHDPYVAWLMEATGSSRGHGRGLNLIELLLLDRQKGIPGEVAFLKIQRAFDATFSPNLLRGVDRILETYDLEATVVAVVLPKVNAIVRTPSQIAASRLATSYSDTRVNLRALLDEQVRKYEKYISRLQYERLQWFVHEPRAKLQLLMYYHELLENGHAQADVVRQLQAELLDLRTRLGLSDSFPLSAISDVVTAAFGGTPYEQTLTLVFAPKETREMISILRFTDEVGEVFRSSTAARHYLRELQKPTASELNGSTLRKFRF